MKMQVIGRGDGLMAVSLLEAHLLSYEILRPLILCALRGIKLTSTKVQHTYLCRA
jgi:hypothetical protein